ncbi:hypothetical protein MLD38_026881 [Melastoma candidum]|uniref:Uncharacterized protein n=1 Tax=Melastoma candidum TaxID=119954 RepID=A0ACB9P3F3_9MYRT|nr:hypothetical protein MLD38_026881 [Melastoma candidum]
MNLPLLGLGSINPLSRVNSALSSVMPSKRQIHVGGGVDGDANVFLLSDRMAEGEQAVQCRLDGDPRASSPACSNCTPNHRIIIVCATGLGQTTRIWGVLPGDECLDFPAAAVFTMDETEMGSGEAKEGLGPKRCSKTAMTRNKETRTAAATNPKENAFMGDATPRGGYPRRPRSRARSD